MSTAARLGAFGALLAIVFGIATVAGGAADPERKAAARDEGHGDGMTEADANGSGAAHAPAGLSISDGGYRLAVTRTVLAPGRSETLRFRVLDGMGRAVREFPAEHGARLHLIVARRDLTGYQHVHPSLGADGVWTVRITLPEPGAYRMYADFSTAGKDMTLGADLLVPGNFRPRELPAPARTTSVDGYEVQIAEPSEGALRFKVSRHGREVTDLEPYLGARGHLVALREGDLAYLHVHPEEGPAPGAGISFHAEYPSAGRYRLFLQFKHDGRVHTTAYTREVAR